MEERRKFRRWHLDVEKKTILSQAGLKHEASLLDISAGGMKVSCNNSFAIGTTLNGIFELSQEGGPFYVRGRVCRLDQRDQNWEIAVVFEKIRTCAPLT
jgi:hypothetical protein